MDELLDRTLKGIQDKVAAGFTAQELADAEALDPLLVDFGNGQRVYEVRWAQYDASRQEAARKDSLSNVLGQNWSTLAAVKEKVNVQRAQVEGLAAKLPPPFAATCKYFLDRALEFRLNAVVDAYRSESARLFNAAFSYPLVKDSPGKGMDRAGMEKAAGYLKMWERELSAESLKSVQSPYQARLEAFADELKTIKVQENIEALGSAIEVAIPEAGGAATWRAVRLDNGLHNLDAGSTSITIPFGGKFNATFYDFYDQAPRKLPPTSISLSSDDLVKAAKNGESMELSLQYERKAIRIKVNGTNPNNISRPSKQQILAALQH